MIEILLLSLGVIIFTLWFWYSVKQIDRNQYKRNRFTGRDGSASGGNFSSDSYSGESSFDGRGGDFGGGGASGSWGHSGSDSGSDSGGGGDGGGGGD